MGDDPSPGAGKKVGRYMLLRPLGSGGMAIVYAAHDPDLDRTVALKLLRRRSRASAAERARKRLMREAQALAGLSHPNIVTVLDVGTHEDQVFLAMELVQGETLGQWSQRERRSWHEIVRVMIDAGRGLAAAHARGFVHRDFKPENVMLGEDGRARVMDFGLVLGAATGGRIESDVEAESAHERDDVELTRVGAAVGTPPYMAPEQHEDGTVGPLSDIYAFCVTLYELLYRRRPFAGVSLDDFAAEKRRGIVVTPRSDAGVPGWLFRVVARGLSPEPKDRWPSMNALIDALARGRRRARMRLVALGLGLAAVGTVPIPFVRAVARERINDDCVAAGTQVDDVWNEPTRAALVEWLHATGAPHADMTASRTTSLLDDYAARWREARTEACLDTNLRDAWTDAMLDAATWCLDERRIALQIQIAELSRTDVAAAHHFVAAAEAMPPIAVCRDTEFLRHQPLPPKARRGEVEQLRTELVRARALANARDLPGAVSVARGAARSAMALDWPPLTTETHLRLGTLLLETGDIAEAEDELTKAFYLARSLDMSGAAVDAASLLIKLVGRLRDRPDDAMVWARHGEAALERIPGDARLRRALLLTRIAAIDVLKNDSDAAMRKLEDALALESEAVGEDHPSLAVVIDEMARVERVRSHYPEARALIDRGLAIRTAALGPDHPDTLVSREVLAALLAETGELDEARATFEDLLTRRERASGARSFDVAKVLSALAMTTFSQGDYAMATEYSRRSLALQGEIFGRESLQYANELNTRAAIERKKGSLHEARRMFTEVLEIRERILGTDHAKTADAAMNLADAERALGRYDEAEQLFERTLVSQRKTLGEQHSSVGLTMHNLANLRLQRGDLATARKDFEEAIAIMHGSLGTDHPLLAYPLTGLGNALIDLDECAAAIEPLERALALRTSQAVAGSDRRDTRFALARALWNTDRDRERALVLAESALAEVGADPGNDAIEAAKIEAWLRTRR